jgi:hypothetical protein
MRITVDGEYNTEELAEPLYESAGKMLGGRIEHVSPLNFEGRYCLIMNGEAEMMGMPENRIGRYLYETDETGEAICGDVVILKDIWTSEGIQVAGLEESDIASIADMMDNMPAEECCG